MNKLPKTLKRLRSEKGILQKQLALYLHCSVGTVCNYEKGVHYPDIETLVRLADYYDVTLDYLVGRTDYSGSISALNRIISGRYTVAHFLGMLDRLSREELPYLVYMLKLFGMKAMASKKHS